MILQETVRRSGVELAHIDDVISAESHYGGGDMARGAAAASGMDVGFRVRRSTGTARVASLPSTR